MTENIIKAFITKWQGKTDIDDDIFWNEYINTFRSMNLYRLALPLVDSPEVRAQATSLLKCKRPCGDCCHFGFASINYADALRIIEGKGISWKELGEVSTLMRRKGQNDMWAIKGNPCPFLKNERCSIYEFRPEVCRNYPIIRSLWSDGHYMLTVSIRCDSGANMARDMIRLHLKEETK